MSIRVRCIKSLFKSTYDRNAFTARKTYVIADPSEPGLTTSPNVTWVKDNEGNWFSFVSRPPKGNSYLFDDYFRPLKEPRPKLQASWSKKERDLMYQYPTTPDGHLLHYFFDVARSYSGQNLREELEARGYDLKTLKFSVERVTTGKCKGGHAQRWGGTQWVPCNECQPEELKAWMERDKK